MIKEPLAFLETLLLIGVFKVLLLLTLERRVVYASHEHIQQIRNSTPYSMNSTKREHKTILHIARIT
jgi:hypothetical protein